LLRRRWQATLAFALVVGLVGGTALAAWAASRRSRDAYSRFVEHVAAPQYAAFFCAPGTTKDEAGGFGGCPTRYD
jgi:hypothetical protein